ncbi:MAG TPA: hypothetical protein VLW84_13080 [Terriglobales bacterium]|nr:hypothetical protein [Terriglobales bacterium]
MRKATSFTIDSELLAEITACKGNESTSDRVNHLLKRALDIERQEELERQAAEFFRTETRESRQERAAYQKASKRAISRD